MKSAKSIPHPIDVAAGAELRAARKQANVSQEALAQSVGLTFQQIQKYENGTNRISLSKLVAMADRIGVDPADIVRAARETVEAEKKRGAV